jgi:hypothetical protein
MLGKEKKPLNLNENFVFFSEFLPIFSKSRYSYTTRKGSDWTLKIKN